MHSVHNYANYKTVIYSNCCIFPHYLLIIAVLNVVKTATKDYEAAIDYSKMFAIKQYKYVKIYQCPCVFILQLK